MSRILLVTLTAMTLGTVRAEPQSQAAPAPGRTAPWARGITGDRVDSLRFAEARAGKLQLPRHPGMPYSLTGPPGSFDPATGSAPKARPLFVVYVPFATGKSMGLATTPVEGAPWIMHPGTPKAHIMFEPRM